jgi:methionine-rich copper-binding protein CopC
MPGLARLAVVLLGACLSLVAAPVSAHDELVGTTPADGAVVETVPESYVIEFFEPVRPGATLLLRDDADDVVGELEPVVDDRVVSAPLPADLEAGTYAVSWQVLSEDGHVAQGVSRFAVGAPTTSMEYVGQPAEGDSGSDWLVAAVSAGALLAAGGMLALVLRRRSHPARTGDHDAA